jgi:FKBP-type peptidyl-prolyl cis-trans isomerase 2
MAEKNKKTERKSDSKSSSDTCKDGVCCSKSPASPSKGKGKSALCGNGDVACVHYTGSLDSGEVFDTSRDRDPLSFIVGAGQLIKGFDVAVVGMKVGDKKKITIAPADAYGERDDRRIQKLPRSQLPKEPDPQPGMMLIIRTPNGGQFPARIEKVEKDDVLIDFNHPLAGKTLTFEIELVEIKENTPQEGCSCCH